MDTQAKLSIAARRKIRTPASTRLFYVVGITLVTLFAILCIVPLIIIISGSFTSEQYIRFHGYSIFPAEFSTEAYKSLFKSPQKVLDAYGVSIFITVIGTFLGLILTTMTAYVISRKDFKYRNALSFFFYFTTLFNGGMVSTYIFYIQYLHLKDSLIALILPGVFNVFYLLIMRSFVSSIPSALIEAARIDGAGELRTFVQIVLPLLGSGLATIGLFTALYYWNNWYYAMLYLTSTKKYPLQYMLYDLLNRQQAMMQIAGQAGIKMDDFPSSSMKMAMAVIATGPIILLYPFVQKFFVKGVTIGSVKG